MEISSVSSVHNKQNITWPLGDTNFIFSCWKYLSLVSAANEWEILSALEDKIRIPARPCNILYKCNSAVFYPVKFGWLDQDEKKNHLMVNFQWAKFIWLFCWFVGLFGCWVYLGVLFRWFWKNPKGSIWYRFICISLIKVFFFLILGAMPFKDQCLYWHNYFRTLHQVTAKER